MTEQKFYTVNIWSAKGNEKESTVTNSRRYWYRKEKKRDRLGDTGERE